MDHRGEDKNFYWELGFKTVKELETEQGILASGRNEAYGTVFGRDSLITSLKLMRVYKRTNVEEFLALVKKVLLTMASLQGREVNVESGEQPGKIIHEFRENNHEFLTRLPEKPWYVYPDNVMRSYDSLDATPLYLIAAYRYWQASGDREFIKQIAGNIQAALQWMQVYADSNGDGFVDYEISPERTCGGLVTQSWMDSAESVFHESGEEVAYPVAPVEAQAYVYLALKLWANYFLQAGDGKKAKSLSQRAGDLKRKFNEKFVLYDDLGLYLAAGLDGAGRQLKSLRSSPGHVLWAALNLADDGKVDGLLYKKYIPALVRRLMQPDLFEARAGLRTLSKLSVNYEPNSYHNGSIWPHDNALITEGLENYGFKRSARKIRRAVLNSVAHFATPIELFVFDSDEYREYEVGGKKACRQQAWSAAAILDMAISELQ